MGRLAPGAHDMSREFRVLSRLWKVFPAAPRALVLCEDPTVIGAPFFVMEYRAGVGIWDEIPDSMRHHPDVGQRVGNAVVDALADLHRIDPAEADLSGLGKGVGFVARQIAGWRDRWLRVAPENGLELMLECADELARTQPNSPHLSLLHNDPKLDNCQFDPTDPDRVKSMFDWDQATIGDPLVDLGILLNYWPDLSETDEHRAVHIAGMEAIGLPSRDRVIDRYRERTGFDVSHVRWYEAFATWKNAIIRQQLYVRYLRGESTDPRMVARGSAVPRLAERARRLLTNNTTAN
jgi:aminoglycoside phosphotransferase (APT) family kinase protein